MSAKQTGLCRVVSLFSFKPAFLMFGPFLLDFTPSILALLDSNKDLYFIDSMTFESLIRG